jgi:acyl-coenzyme A synthetase/AMP-(fatty) acid ligase
VSEPAPPLAAGAVVRAPVAGALNLARACLAGRARDPRYAGRPALTFRYGDRSESWTYAAAWERVERIGRGLLARGLEPGDRVLVRLPHSPAYAFAFFGANAAGLVPVPASPQLTAEEAAFLAADAAPRAACTTPELALPGFEGLELGPEDLERLDGGGPLPETAAEAPAFLIYTSGTQARPKGVLHAQRTLYGRALMWDAWEGFGAEDVALHAGTLNWSYTLGVGLMDVWASGGHAMLYGGPPGPAVWAPLIAAHGVTVFTAVPTVYRQLLKYGAPEEHDLSSLRHGLCAGEPLLPALRDEWRARVGTELFEALGMTEVSTYVSSGPATPVRPGSPGRPQPGRRVAILAEDGDLDGGTAPLPAGEAGLLAVHRSDPGLMLGYWRRPEEEAAVFRGEWFTGGDLAALDEDGYVWFQGRADDVIKSFGYRLSPVEIEAALESAPGVSEVAVVGLQVDPTKTLVTACVVPEDGVRLDEAALRAHAEAHLAGYKQPHQYALVEDLPRTRNGKLQRRALIERLRER